VISPSEQKVFHFITQFIREKGFSPTLLEIAHGVGVKSKSLMSRYVHALHRAGYIRFHKVGHRRISLPARDAKLGFLPILGSIAAGKPIEAIEIQEDTPLPKLLFGEDHYALRVRGDSMIEEGILNGDLVICKKQDTASEGQIVVALIDGVEATLKKIHYAEAGQITLLPANAMLNAVVYESHRVKVQGIFVGLLRLPS
jgi:repressor LexA